MVAMVTTWGDRAGSEEDGQDLMSRDTTLLFLANRVDRSKNLLLLVLGDLAVLAIEWKGLLPTHRSQPLHRDCCATW